MKSSQIAGIIDHTLLRADATADEVRKLCAEAREYGFASVCINPYWVPLAAAEGVTVCTVIGFPLGANTTAIKVAEAQKAIADGACEIDMVINIGALKGGDLQAVEGDIRAVKAVSPLLKVIIETALLNDEQKMVACELAKRAAADFVKTSTGFSTGGATVHDVALMRRVVGDAMGVKASGGIRTLEDVQKMVAVGATRIGASAGVAIVKAETPTGDGY